MEKLIILLLFNLFNSVFYAQNRLYADTTSSGPNEEVIISVKIDNAEPFTAFQLDIQLPSVLKFLNNSVILEESRKTDHQVSSSVLTNNILRIIAFSPGGEDFAGSKGTILRFNCLSKQTPGTFPVTISNAIVSNKNHENILDEYSDGFYTLYAPQLSVDAVEFDFGRLALQQTSERYLNITNTGNLPLIISRFSSTLSEIGFSDSSSVTIQPAQSIMKVIKFEPVKKGNKSGLLIIESNSTSTAAKQIIIKGIAYAVNEIHIGNVFGRSGYDASLFVSINNMEEFSAFEFTIILPEAMKYKSGSAHLFRQSDHLVLADTLKGNKLKVIAFSNNNKIFSGQNGDVLKLDFSLIGTGGYYSIPVEEAIIADSAGTNILSASYSGNLSIASPVISLNPNEINFGMVSILDTGKSEITISNYGNDTLKIFSAKFDSNLFTGSNIFPIIILPYNSFNFPVEFKSGIKGNYKGNLILVHNDLLRNPTRIQLTATAYAPNVLFVGSVIGEKSDTLEIPVKIRNTETFTAFQFDITLPQGINLIANSIKLGHRATANHSISYSFITSTKIRILAYSINQSLFSGDSGSVCSFKVILNGNYGDYPLLLSNGIIGNSNNQNIITSTLNGNIKILPKTKVYGKVTFGNQGGIPLSNVLIILQKNGVDIDSSVTDTNGQYYFKSVYDDTYMLKAISNQQVNGITSIDALLIRRFVVGLNQLSALQQKAADVNKSGVVNSTDALLIRRYIVGQISSFPLGSWVFEDTTFAVNGEDLNLNFSGMVVGDVNGSYTK